MKNRLQNWRRNFDIFCEDVLPGVCWQFMLWALLSLAALASVMSMIKLDTKHPDRPPGTNQVTTVAATTPQSVATVVVNELQASGYTAGPTIAFVANNRYNGVVWQPKTAGAPIVVLYADGSHKDLVAQVRSRDGSFWCIPPTSYRDKPAATVDIFNKMSAQYMRFFAIGETLPLTIPESTDQEVTCSRVV